jgi:hypothetical protein
MNINVQPSCDGNSRSLETPVANHFTHHRNHHLDAMAEVVEVEAMEAGEVEEVEEADYLPWQDWDYSHPTDEPPILTSS